jgi:prepilin-type N-terminal cleavage/methylation domain-containing protein
MKRRAFTLIEVLVVISIVVIMLAVAVPTIRALTKGNSQKQAVNLMTTMLANARATAISTHKPTGIVIYEYPAVANKVSNEATSFIQPVTQSKYDGANKVRYFTRVQGSGPQRLPSGIQVATLDAGVNAFRTQSANAETAAGGNFGASCRVILFDSNGQMLLANGIGTDPSLATDAVAQAWNLHGDQKSSGGNIQQTRGSSSPGFLIYDAVLFNAEHTAAIAAGNEATADPIWLRQNSDVLVVNAYTGNVIR